MCHSDQFFSPSFVRLLDKITGQFYLAMFYWDEFAVFETFYSVMFIIIQIIEDELPKIYTKKPSQVELGSDSASDPEYLDYLKETQAKNKRQKNGKKPKQFFIPQEEGSENYFSTSEDEVIDIKPENEENSENSENSCIEEIFENYNNSEYEENRLPSKPPPPNSKSTREILTNKNTVECRDQLTMRKDNYVHFVTANGTPRDNGSKSLEKCGSLLKFKNLQKGTAREIKKGNYYRFALPVEEKTKQNLSETLNNMKFSIYSLHELSRKFVYSYHTRKNLVAYLGRRKEY